MAVTHQVITSEYAVIQSIFSLKNEPEDGSEAIRRQGLLS
jgi:hypothetical protein